MGLVVPLHDRFKSYNESQPQNSLLNVHGITRQGEFWTKSGGCGVALQYRGIDPECFGPERVDSITALMDDAHRAFDEKTIVKQFLFKRSRPEFSAEDHENPITRRALRNRLNWLQGRADHLYSFETFLVIERKPDSASPRMGERLLHLGKHPRKVIRELFSARDRVVVLDREFKESLKRLRQSTESFLERSADCISARVLTPDEAFLFFRRLVNPDQEKAKAAKLAKSTAVDFQVVGSDL